MRPFRDGTSYRIDRGRVVWISDRNGNLVNLYYEDPVYTNLVTRIVDPLNRQITAPSTTFQAYKKAQEALQKLEDMTFTDAEVINGFSQTSARIDSSAGDIAEDLFAAGLLESVLLHVRILVGGGDPCIADPHALPPVSELNPDQRF